MGLSQGIIGEKDSLLGYDNASYPSWPMMHHIPEDSVLGYAASFQLNTILVYDAVLYPRRIFLGLCCIILAEFCPGYDAVSYPWEFCPGL